MIKREHEFKDVTEQNYSNYFDHTIKVTVSDSKVHVSNRAKHDKSKSLKAKTSDTLDQIVEIKRQFGIRSEDKDRVKKLAENWVPRSVSKNAKNDKTVIKPTKAEKFVSTVTKSMVSDETEMKKNKFSTVDLALSKLFTNQQSIIEHGVCQGGIFDLYCQVTLEEPFISDKLEKILNPMLIQIKSVGPLPNSPISIAELRKSCSRPFVQFSLFYEVYTTQQVDFDENLRFNTSFVILTGRVRTRKKPLKCTFLRRKKRLTFKNISI